jgi:hypothetical protein
MSDYCEMFAELQAAKETVAVDDAYKVDQLTTYYRNFLDMDKDTDHGNRYAKHRHHENGGIYQDTQ